MAPCRPGIQLSDSPPLTPTPTQSGSGTRCVKKCSFPERLIDDSHFRLHFPMLLMSAAAYQRWGGKNFSPTHPLPKKKEDKWVEEEEWCRHIKTAVWWDGINIWRHLGATFSDELSLANCHGSDSQAEKQLIACECLQFNWLLKDQRLVRNCW